MEKQRVILDRDGSIAIARLNHGVTNPIDEELITQLTQMIQKVKNQADIHSLVISSANEKFFSIGFDIPHLIDKSESEFGIFFRQFNQMCLDLLMLPKPTIAAITGHATAGGYILALCCDYRYLAQGKKLIGLNEIKLGVPVPYVADCVLRNLVGFRTAREVMDMGEFYLPEASLAFGLVDFLYPLDQVLPKSIAKASQLGAMEQIPFASIKHNRNEGMVREIRVEIVDREQSFLACWYSEAARKHLKEAALKF
jgi:enoyl-CoA hydratase/carnithine racemase